ncbi:MAG: lipopolysaccharide heptosyltransferase II [Thermodesulfobacteriota bacterium]
MKILIIKLSSIGDVVQTLPALESLRRGHPRAKIDWLVEEAASDIVVGHPMLDEVVVVKGRGWVKDTAENFRVARSLAEKRYDMVLDFQGLLKSGIWVYFSKGERRVGFANAREMSHLFLTEKLPPYDIERHAVERYLDLARCAGGAEAEGEAFSTPLHVGEEAGEAASGLLEDGGINGETDFFVVNPRARWETKLWPEERFAEVIRLAQERLGMRAVIVGSPPDRAAAERIAEMAGKGNTINLAGRTSLKQLAFVMGRASFVLTVDSGPMHMAAAAGTPVVAIFGPTAPWRTGPYGKMHSVIRKEMDCSPCFSRKCARLKCMDAIAAEDVMDAIVRLGAAGEPVSAARAR